MNVSVNTRAYASPKDKFDEIARIVSRLIRVDVRDITRISEAEAELPKVLEARELLIAAACRMNVSDERLGHFLDCSKKAIDRVRKRMVSDRKLSNLVEMIRSEYTAAQISRRKPPLNIMRIIGAVEQVFGHALAEIRIYAPLNEEEYKGYRLARQALVLLLRDVLGKPIPEIARGTLRTSDQEVERIYTLAIKHMHCGYELRECVLKICHQLEVPYSPRWDTEG